MAILILCEPGDDQAAHLERTLSTRSVPVEFLNSADFPAKIQISFLPGQNFPAGVIQFEDGRHRRWEEFTAIYWRQYNGVGEVDLPDSEQAYIAYNDARSFFESLLKALPIRMVNCWDGYELHQTKPAAMALVAQLSLRASRLPATWTGNDPASLLEFTQEHPACIFKPVQGGAHTRKLDPEFLSEEHLQNLAFAPVTIQEEIPGTDVRVWVAGEKVMACEIHTDAVDFRDDPGAAIVEIPVEDDLVTDAKAIAQTLKLCWTGMDFRRTDDGEHVFLEANPSPMFVGFEERSGLPLTDALCDLLLSEEGVAPS